MRSNTSASRHFCCFSTHFQSQEVKINRKEYSDQSLSRTSVLPTSFSLSPPSEPRREREEFRGVREIELVGKQDGYSEEFRFFPPLLLLVLGKFLDLGFHSWINMSGTAISTLKILYYVNNSRGNQFTHTWPTSSIAANHWCLNCCPETSQPIRAHLWACIILKMLESILK